MYVAETPFWTSALSPQYPDENALSVAVAIQFAGSVPLACQTLADRVVPTIWNRSVYAVPALAAKGTLAKMVVLPLTFFCRMRFVPSIYALYQLLVSVKRRTAPRLELLNALMDPVKTTCPSVADGPSVALRAELPFAT